MPSMNGSRIEAVSSDSIHAVLEQHFDRPTHPGEHDWLKRGRIIVYYEVKASWFYDGLELNAFSSVTTLAGEFGI